MVSKAGDDLPEPLRPVMTTSLSRGMESVRFLRLCSRAPPMLMNSFAIVRQWAGQAGPSRNIQHPTFNLEHTISEAARDGLDVECSMLNVGRCQGMEREQRPR